MSKPQSIEESFDFYSTTEKSNDNSSNFEEIAEEDSVKRGIFFSDTSEQYVPETNFQKNRFDKLVIIPPQNEFGSKRFSNRKTDTTSKYISPSQMNKDQAQDFYEKMNGKKDFKSLHILSKVDSKILSLTSMRKVKSPKKTQLIEPGVPIPKKNGKISKPFFTQWKHNSSKKKLLPSIKKEVFNKKREKNKGEVGILNGGKLNDIGYLKNNPVSERGDEKIMQSKSKKTSNLSLKKRTPRESKNGVKKNEVSFDYLKVNSVSEGRDLSMPERSASPPLKNYSPRERKKALPFHVMTQNTSEKKKNMEKEHQYVKKEHAKNSDKKKKRKKKKNEQKLVKNSPRVKNQSQSPRNTGNGGNGEKNIENYGIGALLGEGANGRVFLCMNQDKGEFFALKEIKFENVAPELMKEKLFQIQKEINIMKKLKHENIVQYYGAKKKGTNLHIFLEYVPGGSLNQVIKTYGRLSENVVLNYTNQALKGLKYLHDNNVIHRDIKTANILVNIDSTVRLADFGCSIDIKQYGQLNSLIGTPNYMAPEVIMQSGYGKEADIWSLGCTILEMLTGRKPFFEFEHVTAVMYHIASTDKPPAFPDFISEKLKNFLTLCFIRDPKKRPNVNQLIHHDWLREYNETEDVMRSSQSDKFAQSASDVSRSQIGIIVTKPAESVVDSTVFNPVNDNFEKNMRKSFQIEINKIKKNENVKINEENFDEFKKKINYLTPKIGFDSRFSISQHLFEKTKEISKGLTGNITKKFRESIKNPSFTGNDNARTVENVRNKIRTRERKISSSKSQKKSSVNKNSKRIKHKEEEKSIRFPKHKTVGYLITNQSPRSPRKNYDNTAITTDYITKKRKMQMREEETKLRLHELKKKQFEDEMEIYRKNHPEEFSPKSPKSQTKKFSPRRVKKKRKKKKRSKRLHQKTPSSEKSLKKYPQKVQ